MTRTLAVNSLEENVDFTIIEDRSEHLDLLLELRQGYLTVRVRIHQIEESLQSDILLIDVLLQLILNDAYIR